MEGPRCGLRRQGPISRHRQFPANPFRVVTLSGSSAPQRILSIFSDASGMTGTIDGAFRNGNTSSAYQVSGVSFWIGGGGPGQSTAGDWIGTVSEATVFNVTLSTSQRQALERNQGSYYGITVQ